MLHIDFEKQIETININKSNYKCDEKNSNSFMHCMENYYSRKLGCKLPWSMKNKIGNDSMNICTGKGKFEEFRNISMNILKSEESKELTNEGCFMPNCKQRSWKIRRETKSEDIITKFQYDFPEHSKVLVREEVELYTIINFFAEVGGYLGLLLGESLISYIITASRLFQIVRKKFNKFFKKSDEEKPKQSSV